MSETNLDDSFSIAHFQMKGFSVPYRYGRNGAVNFFCGDIQSRLLISKLKCKIETLSVVANLRKRKYFLNCSYNANQNSISNHL